MLDSRKEPVCFVRTNGTGSKGIRFVAAKGFAESLSKAYRRYPASRHSLFSPIRFESSFLKFNPCDVLSGDNDKPNEPTCHVHLDLACVRRGRFSGCLNRRGARKAVFISASEDDIPILCSQVKVSICKAVEKKGVIKDNRSSAPIRQGKSGRNTNHVSAFENAHEHASICCMNAQCSSQQGLEVLNFLGIVHVKSFGL